MSYINTGFLPIGTDKSPKEPLGLKIAAIYLIIAGLLGTILLITSIKPPVDIEISERNLGYKIGLYSREIILITLYITSGIGLFYKKLWARKCALWVIPIAAIYSIFTFAWGMARGKPGVLEIIIASIIVLGWNGLWFYMIFRKSTKEYLLHKTSQPATQADIGRNAANAA